MNIDLLRAFFSVVEHGSLNRASEHLHLSQSTLTRQMHTLEQEVGGPVLERGPGGVALTATGHTLVKLMRPVLADYDHALAEVRKRARGQSAELRVGYLMSAVADYLNPALAALRQRHPEIKITLLDLSPGAQMTALRRGELDVALIGATGRFLTREFYLRTLATLPLLVALPARHALAKRKILRFAELRDECFIGAPDADLPGYNRSLVRLGRQAGFRVRFGPEADSLTHGLLLVVTEGGVSLIPAYARSVHAPGVVHVPLHQEDATYQLMVAWQRGPVSQPLTHFLKALHTRSDAAA